MKPAFREHWVAGARIAKSPLPWYKLRSHAAHSHVRFHRWRLRRPAACALFLVLAI
jgi:hypothetical protein